MDKLGFNRAMEEVRREFKKVCGAANADALVATMDYAKFFGEYCSKVAETVTDDLPRRAPPVRLADQSINPAFLEDMKRRPHVYDLDEFQWSIANNMNVDQYSYGGTNLIDSKPFTQLDGIEQDLIGQFGSSGDFMAECVSASLVPQETSETTEPVVEDTESKSIESEH